MARQFRHLSSSEIRSIIVRYQAGEKPMHLAREFKVDHSTITYHVKKYNAAYPEQGGVYAFIKTEAKKVCLHPSCRCTLCGDMMDMLLRNERRVIEQLQHRLDAANSKLRVCGMPVE